MALTTIPSAGAKLRGSVLSAIINESRIIPVRKLLDQTRTNNTLTNDTELFVPVVATGVYLLESHIVQNSGTTPDFKVGWTFPTGLTMSWRCIAVDTTSAIVSTGGFDQTTVVSFGGIAGDAHISLYGTVTAGANAGTLQLQWAQNTTNASNTIVRAGSTLWLTRIG